MGKNKKQIFRKQKLIWVSDFDGTGYSTASVNLIKGLLENKEFNDNIDLYLFVVNTVKPESYHKEHIPQEYLKDFPKDKIFVSKPDINLFTKGLENLETDDLKAVARRGMYGVNDFPDVLSTIEPDIVFIINDNAYVELMGKIVLKKYANKEKRPKIIGYMPVDCHNFPVDFFKNVEDVVDTLITMNNFSKQEIIRTKFKKPIHILHHPIDSSVYHPIDKSVSRLKILGDDNKEAFIMLNNNNNQSRKRLDITLDAFAKFLEKNPASNAYLILKSLHSSLNDVGKDVDTMIKDISNDFKKRNIPVDFDNRVIVFRRLFTVDELRYLYNMVDLNINTCSGEGWGLIPCEVSLCGVPQIVPNNTSHPEIFKDVKMIKCKEVPWITGRNFQEINNGIMIYLQGYKDYVEAGVNETNGQKIKLMKNCLTFVIAPEGTNDPNRQISGKLGELDFHYLFNNLSCVSKVVNVLKPNYFQVFVKYGETYDFIYDINKNYNMKIANYKINKVNNSEIENLHNGASIKVKLPDVEDTCNLIEYYYLNRDVAKKVGERCREIMLKDFNVEKCSKDLIDILKKEKCFN